MGADGADRPRLSTRRHGASYFIAPEPLELSFTRAEVGSLFLGVLIATVVCGDGRTNWFKGAQLITVYLIIALMFYFMPETS